MKERLVAEIVQASKDIFQNLYNYLIPQKKR